MKDFWPICRVLCCNRVPLRLVFEKNPEVLRQAPLDFPFVRPDIAAAHRVAPGCLETHTNDILVIYTSDIFFLSRKIIKNIRPNMQVGLI